MTLKTLSTTRNLRLALGFGVSAAVLLALGACDSGKSTAAAEGIPAAVTIAYQPGISYAPLLLMMQNKTLEKEFPKTTFTWKQLSSSSAVQDGMISGDIQVGAGSAPQFILGWDKGIKWHYLASMNNADLWLMAKDPKYKSLKDFGPSDKIAMPSPTSVQALVLRKGAKEQLGNAKALDTNIVSMSHPDGLQNLISGQIAGHLTSPPFEFEEKDQGAHIVLHSNDVFGPTMFNGVFLTDDFYAKNTKFADALYKQLEAVVKQLTDDPAGSAKILSAQSGGKTSPEAFEKYLKNPAISFTVTPHGLEKFAAFLKEIGITEKVPGSWKDLVFPPAQATDGS